MKSIRAIFAAALASAVAGGVVGVSEAFLIASTSGGGDEYWLFFFGVLYYGGFGLVLGSGAALIWEILRRGSASTASTVQIGVVVALSAPALMVVRYHIIQRVFHEELPLMSPTGLLTHAALVLAVFLAGSLAGWAAGVIFRFGRNQAFGGTLIVLLGAAWLAGAMTERDAAKLTVQRPVSNGATGKPNVILIIVDTLRADAIEPYGAMTGSTPNFSRFAADSVVFDRAMAQSSWTRPSIATILTGEVPSSHGAVHKMDILPDAAFTLAEALRIQGYWTAGFTTNINVAPVFNFQQGFDEYVYLEPEFYFGATDSATKLAIYKGLRVLRERLSSRISFQHYYQDAAVLNARVLEWLREKPPEPFFLLIHYMDPHDPFFEIPYNGKGVARVSNPNPPAERAAELKELYLQDVGYLDQHMGNLFERMRESEMFDRSLVVLTADHGEEFQDHRGWWHGTTLYDEVLHVPLLVKRPAEPRKGTRSSALVSSIDIVPTIFGAIGVPPGVGLDGRDLHSSPGERPVFSETDLEGNRVTCLQDTSWKLVLANEGNPRGLETVELYNTKNDPTESKNLANEDLARTEALRTLLAEMRDAAEAKKAALREK